MYEIFIKLCEENGVTAYRVAKETGIAPSTFTDWKSGRSTPKAEKLSKIAEYFGITVDYLTTGKDKDNPLLSSENAALGARILTNQELLDTIKKYLELSAERQGDIKDFIEMLYEKEKRQRK